MGCNSAARVPSWIKVFFWYNISVAYINPENKKKYDAIYRKKNRAKRMAYDAQYRLNLKKEALKHYGENCSNCGFEHIGALQIDHIENNGATHRKTLGSKTFSGWVFYRWLKKNSYPDGYQTLCANCNFIKQWQLTH